MILTHRTGPCPPLHLQSMPWSTPDLTRMIILFHQAVVAGNVDSLATYTEIVLGFVQRQNTLNAKRAINGHETIEAPSGS